MTASDEKAARTRALHALSLMRQQDLSLSRAASKADTTPATVRQYVGAALEKSEGRWRAREWDRIRRTMRFPTPQGTISVDTYDSRAASEIARYWAAVDRYLRTGNDELLHSFAGKVIQHEGERYPFITNPDVLERLANAGEVRFEELYSQTR